MSLHGNNCFSMFSHTVITTSKGHPLVSKFQYLDSGDDVLVSALGNNDVSMSAQVTTMSQCLQSSHGNNDASTCFNSVETILQCLHSVIRIVLLSSRSNIDVSMSSWGNNHAAVSSVCNGKCLDDYIRQ